MKQIAKLIAIQLLASTASGFCFTAGSRMFKTLSEKTGVLKEKENVD